MTIEDSNTIKNSKVILASLTKLANDMIGISEEMPQDATGAAGPQEVVDALADVVKEIEVITQAIPADSSGEVEAPAAAVSEAPAAAPAVLDPTKAAIEEDEEEDEDQKKLAKQVKQLQAELDSIKRAELASKYANLFNDVKTKQAKYDEVLSSKEPTLTWIAKIESIEQYNKTEGASIGYKPAKTESSWVSPKSRFAKVGQYDGLMNL